MIARFSERHGRLTWVVAGLYSLLLTVGVAEDPAILLAGLAALAAAAAVVMALREPRWALLILIFSLYAGLPSAVQAATGAPVSGRFAIFAIFLLLILQRALGRPTPAIPRGSAMLAIALLAIIATTTVVADDPTRTVSRLLQVASAATLALLIAWFLSEPRWLARAMWAVSMAGASLAAVALLQQVTRTYDNTYGGLSVIKLDGSLARSGGPYEPNFFAQALVLSAALALYLALRARSGRERVVAVVLVALCLGGIGASSSRGAVVAVVVMLVLVLTLRRPRRKVLIPLLAAIAVAVVFALPSTVTERFSSVSAFSNVEEAAAADLSVRGRLAENLAAVDMFVAHPTLGIGADNFSVRYADFATFVGLDWRPVREPHNLFLETLAETGIVGGCIFLVFVWFTVTGAWHARHLPDQRQALLAEGALVGLVGVLTTSVFLHTAWPHIIWTAYGLAWAARMMAVERAGIEANSKEAG